MMRWIRKSYGAFLNAIPSVFLNKYVVAGLAFVVWMVFFDQNKLTNQIKLSREIHELKQNINYFETEIEVVNEARADLRRNKEKYARENYFLKKKDEDVFIIQKN